MSSRRVLLSCAAMAAVVMAGGWYAVATFPLTQVVSAQGRSGGPAPIGGSDPGPLERRAKPITPENPIPRRTFSVTPQNPSDNTTGAVAVGLRLVIDGQGRVAEVRSVGGARGGRDFALLAERQPRGTATPQSVAPPNASFVKAAMDAVRQWQYDPPADGPVAFDVTFAFAEGSEPRLLSHGDSRPYLAIPTSAFLGASAPNGFAPPPPAPAPPGPGGAIRVGGNIALPTKVTHVDPVYPPIAQSARVQGVVIIEILIQPDGRVGSARVLRSIPLLDQAALDAVKQWEFAPTYLNGDAVPVVMTATVQFLLPAQ